MIIEIGPQQQEFGYLIETHTRICRHWNRTETPIYMQGKHTKSLRNSLDFQVVISLIGIKRSELPFWISFSRTFANVNTCHSIRNFSLRFNKLIVRVSAVHLFVLKDIVGWCKFHFVGADFNHENLMKYASVGLHRFLLKSNSISFWFVINVQES